MQVDRKVGTEGTTHHSLAGQLVAFQLQIHMHGRTHVLAIGVDMITVRIHVMCIICRTR
jgi:hypothetical protein